LGFKNRSSYNASKGGLEMLTKSAALELGGSGIRCNAVAPGIIETPLNSSYFQDDSFAATIVDNTPAGTWGRPSDVAEAVAFLCGDGSRFINGATLLVDGGWRAGKGY
jgi:NAD(P)-dependent dehydrogenase (short-subunit alcohol dehydrogenase family)